MIERKIILTESELNDVVFEAFTAGRKNKNKLSPVRDSDALATKMFNEIYNQEYSIWEE